MLAVLSEDEIKIYDAYLHKETIRSIESRHYEAEDKAWCVPISEKNISLLIMLGATLDEDLQKLVKEETADNCDEQPILPMRIKVKPYKHQIRAYNFTLKLFGIGGNV